MKIFLISLLLFFFILAFPILVEIRIFANVLQNFGMATFRIYGLKVYFSKVRLKDKKVIIKTKRKKTEKEIELSSENIDFAKNFFKEVINVLSLRKFCIYTKIGSSNPFVSAIIGGFIGNILNALSIRLKVYKRQCDIVALFATNFYKADIVASIRTRFFITPIDLIISLVRAFKKTKKEKIAWKKKFQKVR